MAPTAHTLAAPADRRRKAALRPSSHFEGGFPEETRPPSLFGKAVSADGTLGDTEDRPEAVRHGYEPGNRYGKNPAHFHRHLPGKCDVHCSLGLDSDLFFSAIWLVLARFTLKNFLLEQKQHVIYFC